jgi:hypothetical protein
MDIGVSLAFHCQICPSVCMDWPEYHRASIRLLK